MARPTEFTRETVEKLLRAIRMGATYNLACMHAGISYETFNRWKNGKFPAKLDDDQKLLKASFAIDLVRAEGDSSVRALGTIQQAAAQGDWKASAWLLERRWPQDYGKESLRVKVSLDVKVNQLLEQIAEEDGLTETERHEFQTDITEYLKKVSKA